MKKFQGEEGKCMKTPITYYGGKQKLAEKIVSIMPEHRLYCEPFFGGGAVFFSKPKSYLEVINDTNENLISFWRELKYNFECLHEMVSNTLDSETEYNRAKDIYYGRIKASLTEQAWAFWVVMNMGFQGTVYGGWSWDNGASRSHSGIGLRHKRERFTQELADRLQDVQISCRDALVCIKNRDTANTLFYLDPPYFNATQKHYSGFKEDDMVSLLDMLAGIKGKFILSNYNSPLLDRYIEENRWIKKEIHTHCSLYTKTKKFHKVKKTEVLVTNFEYETPD